MKAFLFNLWRNQCMPKQVIQSLVLLASIIALRGACNSVAVAQDSIDIESKIPDLISGESSQQTQIFIPTVFQNFSFLKQEYTDTNYGFQVSHPSDWQSSVIFDRKPSDDPIVITKRVSFVQGTNPLTEILIDVWVNDHPLPLIKWFEQYERIIYSENAQIQYPPALQVAGESGIFVYEPTRVGGRARVVALSTIGDVIVKVEYDVNDAGQSLSAFQQIVNTLRPTGASVTESTISFSKSMLDDIIQPADHTDVDCCGWSDPGINSYPCRGGNCTWWAKYKRPDVDNHWGDAFAWRDQARRVGRHRVGRTACQGAIAVFQPREQGFHATSGHVAYVESVNSDGTFQISQMRWDSSCNNGDRGVTTATKHESPDNENVTFIYPLLGCFRGDVHGYVRDTNNQPVAGATVTLNSSRSYTITTDRNGHYRLDGMPLGIATVRARLGGAASWPQQVSIEASVTSSVDLLLNSCNVAAASLKNQENCDPTPIPDSTPIPDNSTPTATPGPGLPADSWYVDYFNDLNLSGGPCNSQTVTLFDAPPQRTFMFKDWGDNPPHSSCNSDFSARIWRRMHLDGGTYNFHLFADDKARLFLDGNLVIDQWSGTAHNESRTITAGDHDLKIEFQDSGGAAWANIWWDGPGYPPLPHETKDPNQWFAAFWQGTEWNGDAFMTFNDGNPLPLDKNWGTGGPGYGLPSDSFSSKYERTYQFDCGAYRFNLDADDYAELDVWDRESDRSVHNLVVSRANNPVQSDSPVNLLDKNYEVRIKHKEGGGDARLYVSWTLLTPCVPTPSCNTPTMPTLIAPSNGATINDTTLFFDWNVANFANEYQIQMDDNSDFSSPAFSINVSTSDYTPNAELADGVYWWRVRGRNVRSGCDIYGPWSNVWTTHIETPLPSVMFANAAYDVNENGSSATITVILNQASGQTVSVSYSTSNGTATAGSDYTAQGGTLTYAPNQTSQSFSIPITNDDLFEANESVNLLLSNPIKAVLGVPATALLTIGNDDQPSPCDSINQIPRTECQALAAFYNSTDQVGETNNWFTTNTPCNDWAGVVCGSGHVTELLLDDWNIHGIVAPELGNLTRLEVLKLQDNYGLTGNIPTTLGNLNNLRVLHLDRNALSGALPTSLSKLTQLTLLHFNDTNLCEPEETNFQSWLSRIPDLLRTNAVCGVRVNMLRFNLSFQTRDNAAGLLQNVPIKVKIKDSSGNRILVESAWLSVTPINDGNNWGIASLNVSGAGLVPGQPYQVFVTGAMHLGRRAITQLYDGMIVNFTEWHPNGANILSTCDVNQDNQVTQTDVDIVLAHFSNGDKPPVNPDPASEVYRSDLNGDSVIDVSDFNACSGNLGLIGDQ